jgi:hypothetical protein
VKVGRAALDDEAIRLIEQLNPDVQFDWPRLLKGQGQPASEPRVPHEARRQRPDRRPQPRPPQAPPHQPQPPVAADRPAEPRSESEERATAPETPPAVEIPPEFVAPTFDDTPTPAHGRLGVEGVQRLRSRYADILGRIPERTQDPIRREELRQQVERLNPDSWASDDAVVQGLEQYEAVLASLKELVGQKRRRRRRGKGRTAAEARGEGSDASASTTEMEDGGSANESTDDEGGSEDAGSGGSSSHGES